MTNAPLHAQKSQKPNPSGQVIKKDVLAEILEAIAEGKRAQANSPHY